MRFLVALILTLASPAAMGAVVKVDSFFLIQAGSPLAEMCGTVSEMTAPSTPVRIVVDARTNKPAIYNTFVQQKDGKFCLTLITYAREATVSVDGQEIHVVAKAAIPGK